MRSFAMTPPTMTSRQALLAVLLAGTIALSVGACGRRGRPEPPPDPNAPVKTQAGKAAEARSGRAQPTFATRPGTVAQDDDDDVEDDAPSVSPQPVPTSRKKSQPFVVPKEPFILDSLL
jgi:predicted small lipoprotein YifL